MTEHRLDLTVRPAACICGRARFAGSPTFVRERFAIHAADAATHATTTATPATAHDERTAP